MRPRAFASTVLMTLLLFAGCAGEPTPIPEPDTTGMEGPVRARVAAARRAIEASPEDPAAWGELGMVSHAHEMWPAALAAYDEAERLDATDPRWPYFRGDVLAISSADSAQAIAAFERSIAVDGDYAPAHLRLGDLLADADRTDEAAAAFKRALELAPELTPARIGLGQARLRQERIPEAVALLEQASREQEANPRAFAALGRAYQLMGRIDEARRVAERSLDGEIPSFFKDPRMAEVIAKGASSALLWDRARAYLEAGDWRQAAAGLERVVAMLPEDPDAHDQLALAYNQSGRHQEAAAQLERVLALDPERTDARLRLVTTIVDEDPARALRELQALREVTGEDADMLWLAGRALANLERDSAAIATLERASRASSEPGPAWGTAAWGTALARSGRYREALEQFEASLAAEPEQARVQYFVGLSLEATGERAAAIEAYRRSMALEPNPPATQRLRALGALE